MDRYFEDDLGNFSSMPFSLEQAKRTNFPRYKSGTRCPICEHTDVRYTKNGACTHCALLATLDLHAYALGGMSFLDFDDCSSTLFSGSGISNRDISFEYRDEIIATRDLLGHLDGDIKAPVNSRMARDAGLNLWVRELPCPKSGHYGIRTLTGECHFCVLERETPSRRKAAMASGDTWYTPVDPCKRCGETAERNVHNGQCRGCVPARAVSPRQAAVAAGQLWYTPLSPCPKCGTTSDRRVNDGACKGCTSSGGTDGRSTVDADLMRASPELVMSRDDAKAYGLKVYRTGEPCRRRHKGFRYVSTKNCIDCLK